MNDARPCGAELERRVLAGEDLSGQDWSRVVAQHRDLRGAKLRGAKLFRAKLECANLAGADLREANLTWAQLAGAILDDADLSLASFHSARMALVSARRARFTGAVMDKALYRALRVSNARDLDLTTAVFRNEGHNDGRFIDEEGEYTLIEAGVHA